MYSLWLLAGLAVLLSCIANPAKTGRALKIAAKKFAKILPAFAAMLALISVVLYLVPDQAITKYLGGENHTATLLTASALGSVALMPGFIVFPLCGVLLAKGVQYMALSAFSTTLMMVGVLSYPVERKYFGAKVTVIRNALSFAIAILIALVTGILFGEVF